MKATDGRRNNGGHSTKGRAGRKPKADEEKSKKLIVKALKSIYKSEIGEDAEDDEAIKAFLQDFAQTARGQQFVAEHLLGKPVDKVETKDTTEKNLPDWLFEDGTSQS